MDKNIKIQLLKNFPLFKDFNDFMLSNIAEVASVVSFKNQEVIYKEGERADSFFLVVKGKVTLYKKTSSNSDVAVYTLEAGSMFGEMSYFNQAGLRTFTAKAHPDTVLFKIPHALLALLQQNNKITNNLMNAITAKQQQYFTQTASILERAQKSSSNLQTREQKNTTAPESSDSKIKRNTQAAVQKDNQTAIRDKINKIISSTADKDKAISHHNKTEQDHKNMLYDQKYTCPVCKNKFFTPKVLSKHVRIEKTDSDFCNHYKGINPLFYEITVCPNCAYSFTGFKPEKLGNKSLKLLKPVLEQLPKKNFCCIRNIDMAIETFIYALTCQEALQAKKSKTALLNLKLAWLHRYKNDTQTEKKYLEAALGDYLTAFSEEKLDIKGELKVMYIIGEFYKRLDQPDMAILWFNKLATHPEGKKLPFIINKAREQWQELRARLKENNNSANSNTSTNK